jgi:simple sugar transport system substrate-binding protein
MKADENGRCINTTGGEAMKRIWVAALAGAAALALAAVAVAQQPLKIGFVYVSPVGDAGWTYQHDLGRKAIEKQFGNKIATKYVENVPEGADAERVIRELAASGRLVFTTCSAT